MGSLAIGTVVLINFPFADLKVYKKRPAVVVAHSSLNTVVVCQITSRQLPGVPGIAIAKADFSEGDLLATSYVRPDKLFTVDEQLASQQQLGVLAETKTSAIRTAIKDLFS